MKRVNCRQSGLITKSAARICADVAQLAEQLICNQQVIGSSPIIGFVIYNYHGQIPERPKGADCKSVAECFGGSNPPLPIFFIIEELFHNAEWSSLEARRAHNPEVTGSNPVSATYYKSVVDGKPCAMLAWLRGWTSDEGFYKES